MIDKFSDNSYNFSGKEDIKIRIGNKGEIVKVSIVVFEINEIDGMKIMMPQIKNEGYDEIIVVDSQSSDKTQEIAQSFGAKNRARWQAAFLVVITTSDCLSRNIFPSILSTQRCSRLISL